MIDANKLQYLCAGDHTTWDDFINEHQNYVKKIVHKEGWLLNESDKDDTIQNTWITVMKVIHRFDPEKSNIKSFLYGVCYNVCRNARKSKGKSHERFVADGDKHINTIPISEIVPASSLWNEEFWGAFHKCLNRIHIHLRRPLLMKEDGMKYDDISKELKLTKQAVASRIFKARKKLRKCFNKYLEDN